MGDALLRAHRTDPDIRGNRTRKGRIGRGLAVFIQERIGKETPAATPQLEVTHPMTEEQSKEPT